MVIGVFVVARFPRNLFEKKGAKWSHLEFSTKKRNDRDGNDVTGPLHSKAVDEIRREAHTHKLHRAKAVIGMQLQIVLVKCFF